MREKLIQLFQETRKRTEEICSHLEVEDFVVQPVEEVSPAKWHLGHTTWFFEEFVLKAYHKAYKPVNEKYPYVFNSYYETAGKKIERSSRGNLSRPTVEEVYSYRQKITDGVLVMLREQKLDETAYKVIELGCQHEQQHQELLLTDIKYVLGHNPLLPVYKDGFMDTNPSQPDQQWLSVKEGLYSIGYDGKDFCYDNEQKRHTVFLPDLHISNRLVTNGEYLAFMEDGAYREVLLWHAEAWDWLRQAHISAPMYWHFHNGRWHEFTLGGLQELDPDLPVTHISYYEAYAFAQWSGYRLPTEFEWEASQEMFHWGDRWEWTESAYLPYPGYSRAAGTLGEYNGKFMVNQKVLRGASLVTAPGHSRPTYRNFFHPHLRWQFTGIRLAK